MTRNKAACLYHPGYSLADCQWCSIRWRLLTRHTASELAGPHRSSRRKYKCHLRWFESSSVLTFLLLYNSDKINISSPLSCTPKAPLLFSKDWLPGGSWEEELFYFSALLAPLVSHFRPVRTYHSTFSTKVHLT